MRIAWIAVVGMAVCMHGHAAGKAEKCPRDYRGLAVAAKVEAAVRPGDRPVSVFVTLYNGGQDTAALGPLMVLTWHWLDLEIIDPSGRKLDYRGPEYKLIYDENERVKLDPGYFWGTRIDGLEKDYDLGKPGTYRLRAIYGRGPMAQCERGTIVSDPVTFEVK